MPESTTNACAIALSGVAKQFGDGPRVLESIDLQIDAGDFVAIIGPSGCGKSTLLRLLAGLSPASGGEISIAGHPPGAGGPEVSFVFQDATLLPWCRVAANVALPLQLRGVEPSAQEHTVNTCLQKVRLSDRADAFPRQLSGGQQMRVSIARALAVQPRLLLLDEPFGALDEMTRNHLNEELLNLRQDAPWTAFFVTHSITEAVFLANRVIVMSANPGRIAHEVRVDLPYPRTATTRGTPEFHELTDRLSRLLHSVEEEAS